MKGLNFKIDKGQALGLLGLNGAGKTTTLKLLAGVETPSSGSISINSSPLTATDHDLRRHIGYLPDHPPLFEDMNVSGYLSYVGRLNKVARPQLKDQVRSIMSATGLAHKAQAAISTLSHGYRQRVGIAQAIIHRPQLIILDEPMNGLDPVQIIEIRDLILSLKQNHTIILSSHLLSEITKVCDKILVLDKGSIIAEGSEESLRKKFNQSFVFSVKIANHNLQILEQIKAMPEVIDCQYQSCDEAIQATITSKEDIRSSVVKHIIAQGGDIISLEQSDAGLEGIFKKLIQNH